MRTSPVDLLGYGIFALCGAIFLGRLASSVRKYSHPHRSMLLSLLVTAIALLILPVSVGAVCIFVLTLLTRVGIVAGSLGVAVTIGAVLGSMAGAWELSKRWMTREPSAYRRHRSSP